MTGMTGDEVGKLLGLMALADNRKPPEDDEGRTAMIAFWLSMIGDLAFTDATQAVQDHYRESREWIMPSDIRQRVKAIRAERVRNAGDLETSVPRELADDPAAYRAWLERATLAVADGHEPLRAIGGAA